MFRADALSSLARLIEAVRPWLRQLVLVGGWAQRLHRLHPLAGAPGYEPVHTRDADFAFARTARLKGNIADALATAGFRANPSGDARPPATRYELEDDDAGFYAEFLVPLAGGGTRREGRPDETQVTSGVVAQKLRHVDLLLLEPLLVTVSADVGVPVAKPAELLLANPVTLMVQKILIRRLRPDDKKAQDVLCIHDTLDLFAGQFPELRVLWKRSVMPALKGKLLRAFRLSIEEQYGHLDDVQRAASRLVARPGLTAESLHAGCKLGLREVFGEV